MSTSNPFHKLLWTVALGGLVGLGLGCVISVGPQDCSECGNTGCNSQEVGGECLCDPGYQFENDDPNDFDCDRIPGKGGDASCGGDPDNPVHLEGQVCICDDGFNWCNPNNLDDLSCCEDDQQAPGDGTDGNTTNDPSTGSESDSADTADSTVDETGDPPAMCEEVESPWNGVEPDPADCPPEGGLYFCSNNEAEGPAGSRYWECIAGEWVEDPGWADSDCQATGNGEFAYGCVDTEDGVTSVCGDGPGTLCNGPGCDACGEDGDVIEYCQDGKLAADSCLRLCTEDGIDGITFEHGLCQADGGVVDCFCCDSGEEGCPI